LGALSPLGIWPKLSLAADAPLTPACRDRHQEQATLPSVPGPYFKPKSPERGDFIDAKSDGHLLTLEGRVLSRSCQPVAHALLDLWHADQDGLYDEDGFRYRGHIYSDAQGRYGFHTIEPAVYPGRTRHFHFKVQAPGRSVLTTQLFFPGEPRNQVDSLFRPQLLMNISDTPKLMSAQFDFVVDA
jgi:protocatechuate 3,4-dioxygenase beta subunit